MKICSDKNLPIFVVGAGIAGLAFLIEAHFRGQQIHFLEKR
jgi:glycerol-3-phosphate dehydrogenase